MQEFIRRLPSGLVLPAATVACDATAVACLKWHVAAHAGHQERQSQKRQPAQTETLFAGIARARVRIVALRVRHAVVKEAVCAPHEAHPPNARLHGVRSFLAASSPVFRWAEHGLAVDTPQALPSVVHASWQPFRRQRPGLPSDYAPADARFAPAGHVPIPTEGVRVSVVVFGWFALREEYVSVRAIRPQRFVACRSGGVAVVLVARQPRAFAGVDPNDLFLLLVKPDVT